MTSSLVVTNDEDADTTSGQEPGEVLLMEPPDAPPVESVSRSVTPDPHLIAGGVAVIVPDAMGYDSDTASSCRLDLQSNGRRSEDESDLVVVRPEAPILDVSQFGLPLQEENSGKGWPFGKRPKRNYSPDERKRRLQSAVDEVLTNQTSLRLAADKWDVAKSSLCDYIRKNNIYVPNLRKNQHPTPEPGSTPVKRPRTAKRPLSAAKAATVVTGFSTLNETNCTNLSNISDRLNLTNTLMAANSLSSAVVGALGSSGSNEPADTNLVSTFLIFLVWFCLIFYKIAKLIHW